MLSLKNALTSMLLSSCCCCCTGALSHPWAAGGIFTHRDALGWQPGKDQMNKQGNWWLQALVQYDHQGEVLHMHRVTGEISINRATPKVSRGPAHWLAAAAVTQTGRGVRTATGQVHHTY